MINMRNYVEKMRKEIENEINDKLAWQKRARQQEERNQEFYCNGALTQLYVFLEKIGELEKLI